MLKILTILPYKENYAVGYAAAASLWVYDFLKYSRHKKNNLIVLAGYGVGLSWGSALIKWNKIK